MTNALLLEPSPPPASTRSSIGLDQLTLTGKLRNLASPPATSRQFGILVADDDLEAVERMASTLIYHWFPIHQAIGGRQAVIVAKARLPKAAIMDFAMLDANGLRSCCQLRKACPHISIVVTADPASAQEAVDAGFEVIQKPVAGTELLSRVSRLRSQAVQ